MGVNLVLFEVKIFDKEYEMHKNKFTEMIKKRNL